MIIETKSFAQGLSDYFSVGALVRRCRITENRKKIIHEMIEDTNERTFEMNEYRFNSFMKAKRWILHQLDKTEPKQELDIDIAHFIRFWMPDYEDYFKKDDYEGACQWLMNKLNKKYSFSEMSMGDN